MFRELFWLWCCFGVSKANYFIRTRMKAGDHVVNQNDIPTYLTLSIPPYTSDFFKEKKGMAHEIIKVIQEKYDKRYGGGADNYTVLLKQEVGPGDDSDGMYADVIDRKVHWAVGPFIRHANNINIATDVGVWYEPSLMFIVDKQSPMALEKIKFEKLHQSEHRFDLKKVQFIFVNKSAEFVFLKNTFNIIPAEYQEMANWLKHPKNTAILVSTVCEGIRLLEDFNSEDLTTDPSKTQAVLVSTDLMAKHYAGGNPHLQIMHTSLHKDAYDKKIFSYYAITSDLSLRSRNMYESMSDSKDKIKRLVWKWMEYDENACEKVEKALMSEGSRVESLGMLGRIFVVVVWMVGRF